MYSPIAQSVEQVTVNHWVGGSSPSRGATTLSSSIAACKSGAKVEVSPEIAEQFKTNILVVANNELARTEAERNPDIPRISNLLFDADKKAHEIVKSREKELGIGQKAVQEQKPHKNERNLGISIY